MTDTPTHVQDGRSWQFWHDYQFRRVNWIEFTLVACNWERSSIYGGSEIHVALLGFHAQLDWIHDAVLARQFRDKCEADIITMETES